LLQGKATSATSHRALLHLGARSATLGVQLCYHARRSLLPWAGDDATLAAWLCYFGHWPLMLCAAGAATFDGQRCEIGRLALLLWVSAFAALCGRRCYLRCGFFAFLRVWRCGLRLPATDASSFWSAASFAASGKRCSCRRQAAVLLAVARGAACR
jgi:hypothetical protein